MRIVPKKFLGYTVYRVKKAIQQVETNRLSPIRAAAASAGKEDKNMAAITVAFVFGTLAYDMYKVICEK